MGLLLSLFHGFSKIKKSAFQKLFMLLYIIVLDVAVSIASITCLLDSCTMPKSLLVVIPGFNALVCILALYLFHSILLTK